MNHLTKLSDSDHFEKIYLELTRMSVKFITTLYTPWIDIGSLDQIDDFGIPKFRPFWKFLDLEMFDICDRSWGICIVKHYLLTDIFYFLTEESKNEIKVKVICPTKHSLWCWQYCDSSGTQGNARCMTRQCRKPTGLT